MVTFEAESRYDFILTHEEKHLNASFYSEN